MVFTCNATKEIEYPHLQEQAKKCQRPLPRPGATDQLPKLINKKIRDNIIFINTISLLTISHMAHITYSAARMRADNDQ
jgi:hypothetical protein